MLMLESQNTTLGASLLGFTILLYVQTLCIIYIDLLDM